MMIGDFFTDDESYVVREMVEWFLKTYEPSREDAGYADHYGGPFDARVELDMEFEDVSTLDLARAAEILEQGGTIEWTRVR